MSHISLSHLSIGYGSHQVLRDISVDIPDGQITAIIGPSGCGKTTLLKTLNRLVDLHEEVKVKGHVLIDGVNIYDPKTDILTLRKKVGFLSQKPYPLPMSIYDNIAFGPRVLNLAKNGKQLDDVVERSLRQAALWDEVKDRLHEPAMRLSGGQQQRLCLARSLALEPEVILLDNPTSGLDPLSTAKVENSLRQLKADYTIVLVPHSVQQAARVADVAAFLLGGELVEAGPGEQLFVRPRQRRTEDYITGRFG